MCNVTWCDKKDRFYKNGNEKPLCSTHSQYMDWVSNATNRPHLMYKLEKILDDDVCCEECGYNPFDFYPNRSKRQLVSLLDVDHKISDIKNTIEGEQPSNYKLVCKSCHVLKSHDDGDYVPKKYR